MEEQDVEIYHWHTLRGVDKVNDMGYKHNAIIKMDPLVAIRDILKAGFNVKVVQRTPLLIYIDSRSFSQS